MSSVPTNIEEEKNIEWGHKEKCKKTREIECGPEPKDYKHLNMWA